MSEVNSVTYLKDYQQPDYWVTHVDLTVDLREGETLVRAVLQVKKNGNHANPLVLDGEELELLEVKQNNLPVAKGGNPAPKATWWIAHPSRSSPRRMLLR